MYMTTSTATPNTSGQGKNALVPPEIRKQNWGAAILNGIWLLGNGLWFTDISKEGYRSGRMFIYPNLGPRANEIAWKYRRWDSVESFLRVQQRWSVMALTISISFLVALSVFVVIGFVSEIKLIIEQSSAK